MSSKDVHCALGGNTSRNEEIRKKHLMCQSHPSNIVKYLCNSHEELLCDTCVKNHCKDCTLINEFDLEAKTKQKFKIIEQRAEKLLKHEKNFRAKLDDEERDEETCMETVKSHIDNSFERVKSDILSETSRRRMNLMTSSRKKTEALEILKGNITHSSYTSSQNRLSSFRLYSELSEYESKINKYVKDASSQYFLVESASCPDIYQRVENCLRIHDEKMPMEMMLDLLIDGKVHPVSEKTVECEKMIAFPERRTSPRYCLWMGKYVIVSVQEERTLEMYDTIDGTFISRYVCKSQPWAITKVDNANFAVAFPYEGTITLMTVSGKCMKNKDTCTPIKTSFEVTAIAYSTEDQVFFAASMNDGRSIQKYDVLGKDRGTVFLENGSGGIYNIEYDGKLRFLFVSCHEADKVVCLHVNGTEIFEYSHPTLKKPWSVALDHEDNIYITYYNASCIHQINKEGKLKNKIVSSRSKEFVNPQGMCFHQHSSRFALLCANAGHMQIFRL